MNKYFAKDLVKQFWLNVDKRGPYECWEWKGLRNKGGYGKFHGEGSHRFALESSIGFIPVDKFVLHKCNNPACCNPRHLYVGTRIDNMGDKHAKNYTLRPTHLLPLDNDLAELYL